MCQNRYGLGRPYPDLQFRTDFTDTGFLQKKYINLHTKSPKKGWCPLRVVQLNINSLNSTCYGHGMSKCYKFAQIRPYNCVRKGFWER